MIKVFTILFFLNLSILGENKIEQVKWYVKETIYEGFPLILRFPEKPDIEKLKKKFTRLLSIEHKFTKVKSNGFPESKYNKSLLTFDLYITRMFEKQAMGKTVLVETYGGNRIYYIYISEEINIEEFKAKVKRKFPEHTLAWETQKDANWKFLKSYSEDFKFYEIKKK